MSRRSKNPEKLRLFIIVAAVLMVALLTGFLTDSPSFELSPARLRQRSIDKININQGLAGEKSGLVLQPLETKAGEAKLAVDPEFKIWLKQEARSLDSVHVDAKAKRDQIDAVVARMTPRQAEQLLNTVKDIHTSSGEKILATYLLVEGGLKSRIQLEQLIAEPLIDHGPREAHSEGELNSVRDKSLRIMAIDGLFSRAAKGSAESENLAKVVEGIRDPYLRGYAQDKLTRMRN
mgnify:CR=1 FL=1